MVDKKPLVLFLTACLASSFAATLGCRERAQAAPPAATAMPEIERCLGLADLAESALPAALMLRPDPYDHEGQEAAFVPLMTAAHRPEDLLASGRAELGTLDPELLDSIRKWCTSPVGLRWAEVWGEPDDPQIDRTAWWSSQDISKERRAQVREVVDASGLADLFVAFQVKLLRNHIAGIIITSDTDRIRGTRGLMRKMEAYWFRGYVENLGKTMLNSGQQTSDRSWVEAAVGYSLRDATRDELEAMIAFFRSASAQAMCAARDRAIERAMDDALTRLEAAIPEQPYVGDRKDDAGAARGPAEGPARGRSSR